MSNSSENIKNVMKNDKQRTIVVSLGVVVVIMLIAGFWFATKSRTASTPVAPVISTGSAPATQSSIPGSNQSADYNAAVAAQNLSSGQQALEQSRSRELTLTAEKNARSAIDATTDAENERRRLAAEAAKPVEVVVTPPTPVVVQLQPVAEPVVQQVVQPAPVIKQPNYTADQYAVIAALSQSYKYKKSAIETDYTSGQNGSKENQNAQMVAGTTANGANALTAAQETETTLMKAGDMLNAVLETAIKSDEPSPVLARVVGGKYNGARAVCSVQGNGEKALVECKRLSLPNMSKSLTVNLVAIDPTSTRSGLATSVDKHYFERYVIGLGAVFLKGYADALSRQNTTTAITGSGSVVVSTGELSNSDIARSGLGEVGKSIADDVKQNTNNLKPTVYVAAGTAIGLMATDDILVK